MQGNFLSPAEIAKYVVDVGQKKAELSPFKQLLLSFTFHLFPLTTATMIVGKLLPASVLV